MDKKTLIYSSKQGYEIAFIVFSFVSFFVWLCCLIAEGSSSIQFDLFFAGCGDFFADAINVIGYSAERDPYHNMIYTGLAEKAYPPLTYVLSYFLSRLVNMPTYYEQGYFLSMYQERRFLIILIIMTIIQTVIVYEWIRTNKNGDGIIKSAMGIAFILSAPFLFSIERGNTIIVTMLLTGVFLFGYASDNKVYKETALIALAIAAAFKMTPALLGILLLFNKQWKEVVRIVIYGLLFCFVPFLFLEEGMGNIVQMFENMQSNLAIYSITEGCTLVANILWFLPASPHWLINGIKISTYIICIYLLFCVMKYSNNWEKLMAVSLVLVILPSHSGQYCILYLFPALIAFFNAERHSLCDLGILFGSFCIVSHLQNGFMAYFFNYHTGILLILTVMLIKGVRTLFMRKAVLS